MNLAKLFVYLLFLFFVKRNSIENVKRILFKEIHIVDLPVLNRLQV